MEILNDFLSYCQEQNLDVVNAVVSIDGKIVEHHERLPGRNRLFVWSISKSFTSIGVGIAIDEGLFNLDDYICDYFPDYTYDVQDPNLLGLKVRHLLTMTSGVEFMFGSVSPERYACRDWLDLFFHHTQIPHAPGEHFFYSNFNPYLLSNIIERKSGIPMKEYLRSKLFEPLRIGNPDWDTCPIGHTWGANGLSATAEELNNFGEMLRCGGVFDGKRIVSEAYIKDATRVHVATSTDDVAAQRYGYGYYFWMTEHPGDFMCTGNYGQNIVVLPEKKAVITIMSLEPKYPLIFNAIYPKIVSKL